MTKWHNRVYNTSLGVQDFHSYDFNEVMGGTTADIQVKMSEFFDSDEFQDMPVVPGSVTALREMEAKHPHSLSFVVVTSRQHVVEEITRSWLQRHFPDLFQSVVFGNHYGLTGIKKNKSELCQELGAALLIDDSLRYAHDCAAHNIHCALFTNNETYPWNQGGREALLKEFPQYVHVSHTWKEIQALVESLVVDQWHLKD
jgi:hypothetical protein